MTRQRRLRRALAWSLLLGAFAAYATSAPPRLKPAAHLPRALAAPLLAGSCAGARHVAVGDHGVVLLSDDGGVNWRQARSVPVDVVLTAVSFVDDRHGWAVGHWGVVLHTADGGETWRLQRQMTNEDRPLFAVHFFNEREGVAVGLWSLVLRTRDGGANWEPFATGLPKASGQADLNLYQLFADERGQLYATAERGQLLRSPDRGRHWEPLSTGQAGSLWAGAALGGGRLVVAGLRGVLRVSEDDGRSWRASTLAGSDAIHGIALNDRELLAVGANGLVLRSLDGARSFETIRRSDHVPLMGAFHCGSAAGGWTFLTPHGPESSGGR